jgi:MFS family permease
MALSVTGTPETQGLAGSEPKAQRPGAAIVGATVGNMLGVTPTVTAIFGLFLVPISQEFGWSRAAVAGAFTALSIGCGLMYPVAGRMADRLGVRPVLVGGYGLLGLAILGLSVAPANHAVFYALFGLAGLIGALPSNMLICKLLAEWFEEGRGFWMGLTGGVGNGLGAAIMPVLAAILMAHFGWRGAFRGVALVVLLVGAPIAFFTLKPRRRSKGANVLDEALLEGVSLSGAIRSPTFWLILSTVPVAGGSLTAIFANTVPILAAQGLSLANATAVVVVFALICTVWEPLVGHLLDRSDRPRLVAPFYLCAAAGLIVLTVCHSAPWLMAGGALAGIGLGSEFSVLPFVLSRYFGLKDLGAISGLAFMGVLASMSIAPIGLNLAFDRIHSYSVPIYVVAALLIYNAIVFVILKPYSASKRAQT